MSDVRFKRDLLLLVSHTLARAPHVLQALLVLEEKFMTKVNHDVLNLFSDLFSDNNQNLSFFSEFISTRITRFGAQALVTCCCILSKNVFLRPLTMF